MTTPMRRPVTFLGIAGSLRRLSFNRGLIRAAVELASDGMTVVPDGFSLCDVIVARWERFTGKMAERLDARPRAA